MWIFWKQALKINKQHSKPSGLWSAAERSTVVTLAGRRLRGMVHAGASLQHLQCNSGFWGSGREWGHVGRSHLHNIRPDHDLGCEA